jgi:hypothetical protein
MLIGRKGRGPLMPWLLGSTLAVLAACAPPSTEEEADSIAVREDRVSLSSIDPSRELFITDVSVVDDARYTAWNPGKTNTDPEGGWSFGRLIDNMVPESMRSPYGRSQFVLSWLRTWEQDQWVNGHRLPARPLIRSLIIDPWRTASGCAGSDSGCVLDFAKAPFRLLAIVNRPDLRRLPTAADPGNAGQGRFVFGALGPSGERLAFTLIFEYQLPISSKSSIIAWAERWHELGKNPFGKSYNDKLHTVTREFTRRDAAPGEVNGSALLQIRTNEIPLSPVEPRLWEMREFVLGGAGQLVLDTVKQEVDSSFNGTATLGAWASQNAAAILAGTHVVPLTWQGQPLLAGAAPVPTELAWVVPGVSEEVRQAFAVSTCSGCHKSETGTNFLHVRTREPGSASQLSAFLAQELSPTGPRVTDFHALLNVDDVDKVKEGKGKGHKDKKRDRNGGGD